MQLDIIVMEVMKVLRNWGLGIISGIMKNITEEVDLGLCSSEDWQQKTGDIPDTRNECLRHG